MTQAEGGDPPNAHVSEHLLALAPDADPRGPGAAITRELCGHWEHDGACRWPHHTAVTPGAATNDPPDGGVERLVSVRTVFVSPPAEAAEVRDRILTGLRLGTDPPTSPGWSIHSSTDSPELLADELDLARRLRLS